MEYLKSNAAEKDAKRQKKEEKKRHGNTIRSEGNAVSTVSGVRYTRSNTFTAINVATLLIFLFLIISSEDGK